MGTGLFNIGVSGIGAAQLGLLATEHNIVNANTVGYTRQRAIQATNIALGTGSGTIGQGVHVETIDRLYDRFLTGQINTATTKVSDIDAYYGQIQQIDSLLADPSAGLTPALQDFFSGVQQVASNPSLLSARQSMVSAAETMINRFHAIESRLTELGAQVNGEIQDGVTQVNSLAEQIADVNQQVIIAQSQYGHPPNDLLDQRDRLINELNQLVRVSQLTGTDGSVSLFIGSGQQLVVGNQAMAMTALASSADNSRIVVGIKTVSGAVIELPEKLIGGGKLAGLTAFRAESLDVAANELGRIAASLALTFNAQHALGQDLLGQATGETGFAADFFSLAAVKPTVKPDRINTGTGVVEAAFVNPPPMDGLYSLGYSVDTALPPADATFSVTRASDGTVWTQSLQQTALSKLAAVSGYTESQLTSLNPTAFQLVGAFDAATNTYAYTLTDVALGTVVATAVATQQDALSGLSGQIGDQALNVSDAVPADYTLAYSAAAGFTATRTSDGATWNGATLNALKTALSSNVPAIDPATAFGTPITGEVTLYGPEASAGNFYTKLTTSDYRLTYDGADYSLTRLSDNKTWVNNDFAELSAQVARSEGFVLSNPSGTIQADDAFLIQPTRAAGRNLELNPLVASDPRLIAAAVPFRTSADAGNSGSGVISIGKTLPGYAAGLFPPSGEISLTFNNGLIDTVSLSDDFPAGTAVSVRSPDGTSRIYAATADIPFEQGMEISVAGLSFTLSGLPDNGDRFVLTRNAAGVADGRNVLALAQLQIQNTMSAGAATFQTSYSEMVARNGIKTRELGIMAEAQRSVLEQSQARRDGLSGVNLDEEAANLLRYQQAYQASAKILEIGKTVFDTLLQLG